jgi:hypothetical protein
MSARQLLDCRDTGSVEWNMSRVANRKCYSERNSHRMSTRKLLAEFDLGQRKDMSPKKIGKVFGDRTYLWHRRVKKYAKVHNSRLVRRRLNRDLDL